MPLTERSWTVHLQPAADASTARFAFPAVALEVDASEYKRYDDLDLVDAGATVDLDAAVLNGGGMPWWGWLILVGGASAAFLSIARHRQAAPVEAVVLPLPQRVTALSALAYLRRIGEQPRVAREGDWQSELAQDVAQLEQQSFAAEGEPPQESELRALLQRWRDRAVA